MCTNCKYMCGTRKLSSELIFMLGFTCNGTRELDFVVLWLDASVQDDHALKLIQKSVQLTTKHLKNMNTEEEFEEYIRSAQLGQTIVVVTTEDSAKIIVPAIHQRCQVGAVFVYNGTRTTCEQWKSTYTKV